MLLDLRSLYEAGTGPLVVNDVDAFTLTDTSVLLQVQAPDTGTLVEAPVILIGAQDTASLLDAGLVGVLAADQGALVEAAQLLILTSDQATLADGSTGQTNVSTVDAFTLLESGAVLLAAPDTGTLLEVGQVGLQAPDAATLTEATQVTDLSAPQNLTAADQGALVEQATVTVLVAPSAIQEGGLGRLFWRPAPELHIPRRVELPEPKAPPRFLQAEDTATLLEQAVVVELPESTPAPDPVSAPPTPVPVARVELPTPRIRPRPAPRVKWGKPAIPPRSKQPRVVAPSPHFARPRLTLSEDEVLALYVLHEVDEAETIALMELARA